MIKHHTRLIATVTGLAFALCTSGLYATDITISEEPLAPRADYNLLLFENLRLDITGLFGVTYDDNINSSEDDEEEALYITPRLNVAIDWPVTPNIKIGSGLNLGYRYHLSGEGNDDFYMGIDGDLSTGIQADIRLGNGVLRVFEKYRRQADTLELAGGIDDDEYVLNRNTVGAHYRVPLNPSWHLKATVDHRNTWTNLDTFERHDNVRDRINVVTSWVVNPQLELGPYYEYEQTDYDIDANNDRSSHEFGLSFLYRTEGAVYFEGNLGYETMNIDESLLLTSSGFRIVDDEGKGLTGRIAAHYASSEFTDHVLSVTYDRDQDILNSNANYSAETRYMYAIATEIVPDLTLRGNIALLDINESDYGEQAKLWRLGAGTSYQIDKFNRIRFDYNFYDKNSDTTNRDFQRNRITVTFVHDF
ncbi:MAG: outer membrane beta-barrel protein [Lentisphaeria bacterium]